MSAANLTVDLVRALAWPVVVLAALIALRRELKSLIREPLTRLEGPGFKAEFERGRVEAEAARTLATSSPDSHSAATTQLPESIVAKTHTARLERSSRRTTSWPMI